MQFVNTYPHPNLYETLMDKAFTTVKKDIHKKLCEGNKFSALGNRERAQWFYNRVNDWYYVIYLCVLMEMDYQDALRLNKTTVTIQTLGKKYELECVRKKLACYGMNANLIYSAFGFGAYNDGISVMEIGDGTVPDPFIVHPLTPLNS